MTRLAVGPADELAPGERTIVEADDGRSVGVFNLDGTYHAMENRCAHQGGPVCTGTLQGAIEGEYDGPGRRVRDVVNDEVPAIACPWHGWEYDLRTGEHLGDPEYTLRTFDVVEDCGTLYVEL